MSSFLNPANQSPLSGLVSGTAGLLQDFAGKDPALWDIVEGTFLSDISKARGLSPVIFHVFVSKVNNYQGAVPRISDKGGRRKVKYSFPYLDGQTTDDLGRKPGAHTFEILLFGLNYKAALSSLNTELDQPGPGTLQHPVLGSIRCVMEDYELIHESQTRKAVQMRLELIEHNFTLGQIAQQFTTINDVKSALASALSALKQVSDVINKVTAYQLFTRSLILQVNSLLNAYQSAFGLQLQNINVTFNDGSSTDIPSLLPLVQGGNGAAPGATGTFPSAASSADAFSGINLPISAQTTLTTVAVQQAINGVNAVIDQCNVIIDTISAGAAGQAALDFYDEILGLKQGVVSLQAALTAGIQSSNSNVVPYITPELMTIREVCFACGLSVDDSDEVEQLNPNILSFNYIPSGTTIQVPIS